MADRIGQQFGNYRLLSRLGKGGFGQVYLGQHVYINTYAAIKLLLEDMDDASGEDLRAAFLKEARSIAALKHPHILRVLEFGVETSTPFLVMEYAAHGTLLERHPRGTKVPLDQVVRYARQIGLALDYAHETGLIHRDLKPANVLLDEQDTILLSDFGIATIVHHTSSIRTTTYAGTPAYMAPEQSQGKPVPASDQYSLAIMVYEWLCGQLPYQGDPFSVGMQHLTAPIPSLCVYNSALSHSIEATVQKTMAKDPKQRFMNVQAFATALEQASQSDQSTFVRPVASPPTGSFFHELPSQATGDTQQTMGHKASSQDDLLDVEPREPPPESVASPPLLPSLPPTQHASTSPIGKPDNKASINENQDKSLETHNVRDAFLGLFLYALSALAESPHGLIRYILGTWFFGLFSLGHIIIGVFSIAQLFGLFLALFPLLWSLAAFIFPSGGGPLIRHEKQASDDLGGFLNREENAQIRTALNQLTQYGVKCPRKWYVTNIKTSQPSNVLGTTLYVNRLSTRYPLTPILAHELGHLNSLDSRLSMARRRLHLLNPLELAEVLGDIFLFLPVTLYTIIELIIGLFLIVIWVVFVGGIGFVLTDGLWSNHLKRRDFAADRYAAKLGQASALITVLERMIRDEYTPSSREEPRSARDKEAAREHLARWIDRLKKYK